MHANAQLVLSFLLECVEGAAVGQRPRL